MLRTIFLALSAAGLLLAQTALGSSSKSSVNGGTLQSETDIAHCVMLCAPESYKNSCGDDVKCWATEMSSCLTECMRWEGQATELTHDILQELEDIWTKTNGIDPGIRCFGSCLLLSLHNVSSWVAECKSNISCWLRKVAFHVGHCLSNCFKPKEEVIVKEIDSLVVDPIENGFAKCMVKCLGQGIAQILSWVVECHLNISCWIKKVGTKAIQCFRECMRKADSMAAFSPTYKTFGRYINQKYPFLALPPSRGPAKMPEKLLWQPNHNNAN